MNSNSRQQPHDVRLRGLHALVRVRPGGAPRWPCTSPPPLRSGGRGPEGGGCRSVSGSRRRALEFSPLRMRSMRGGAGGGATRGMHRTSSKRTEPPILPRPRSRPDPRHGTGSLPPRQFAGEGLGMGGARPRAKSSPDAPEFSPPRTAVPCGEGPGAGPQRRTARPWMNPRPGGELRAGHPRGTILRITARPCTAGGSACR
jgi:hypothetical protein